MLIEDPSHLLVVQQQTSLLLRSIDADLGQRIPLPIVIPLARKKDLFEALLDEAIAPLHLPPNMPPRCEDRDAQKE